MPNSTRFPDGSGYVEDGREIFDEADSDDEQISSKAKKRKSDASESKSKKRLRDVNKSVDGSGSIRKMFGKATIASHNKKENQVKLADDDILAGILGEVNDENKTEKSANASNGPSTSAASRTLTAKTEMAMVKEYMQTFKKPVHKRAEPKKQSIENDEVGIFVIVESIISFITFREKSNFSAIFGSNSGQRC